MGVAAGEELKKDKEIDALAAEAEKRYKEWMEKKSGEAKGVLDRMSSGSDSGLLHLMMSTWLEFVKEEKWQREMDAKLAHADAKFKSLNVKQKGAAKSVASRCHQQEEENVMMMFFYAWSTETHEQGVVRRYEQKLQGKNDKLDAVQTMFRQFANQLEAGINNSPRSKKSTGRSKGGEGSAVGYEPAAA